MGTGDILRLLRRHWLFISLAAILGAALGIGLAAARTPEYTAKADVFVTVTSGQSTGELAQGSSFSQQQARNFAAVVTREIVLAPVIAELELPTAVADLRKSLTVTVPLNTSLISIQASHSDPATAAAIANTTAKHLSKAVATLSPEVEGLQGGAPVRAQLIEAAAVPDSPSTPSFTLFAVFGLLGGLVIGVAARVISDLVVSKVTTAEQIEATLGGTVLGSISRDARLSQHPVAVTAAPLSLRAEEIRQVRTALKFLPDNPHQVYVISSSVSGEGKSTSAANLAAAFAAEGVATCLVEADLRRPRLEEALDLTGGIGLTDVIVGDASLDEALQEWGPDGLQVLLAGRIPPNPSELLGSERGIRTLSAIQQRFDVVVIDTSPLVPVTDASIVARQFGGLVLVVGAGKVRSGDLRQAASALAVADVPIKGTILNLARHTERQTPYAYVTSGSPTQHTLAQFPRRIPDLTRYKPAAKVALAAVLAVTVGMAGMLLSDRASHAASGQSPKLPTTAPAVVETPLPRAVFIGDSLVQGAGGDGVTWVDLAAKELGWKPINLGRGGTGYVTTAGKAGCGRDVCPDFLQMAADAIAQEPDIVVISGGQNDGSRDVDEASLNLFITLRHALPDARIIVVSPLWRASAYPQHLTAMSKVLQQNAKTADIEYLDVGNPLAGRPELFTADGVHPNPDGYRELAKALTKALSA